METIHQALELLTGRPAGARDAEGHYPEHTLLRLATDRAYVYWQMVSRHPTDHPGGAEE